MTLEAFEKNYYPEERSLREIALKNFVAENIESEWKMDLIMKDFRLIGIQSIADLAMVEERQLMKLKHIGLIGLDTAIKLKHKIMNDTF